MASRTTYLDHAATSPLRPEARAAMEPWLGASFGNPSGAHAVARAAKAAIEDAREVVATALCADPSEVVLTGGGTEADNLAVLGVHEATGGVVVCSAVEHHAVLRPVEHLAGRVVPVDRDGVVDRAALAGVLDDDVALVSVMLANNETGVVQPLAELAAVVRERAPRALLHTDAVAAFAWLDVAEIASVADLVSISAHKFGGPQGAGALVARRGVPLAAIALGGSQEAGRRAGTHNVAAIVGMAAAAARVVEERKSVVERVAPLRDRLADGIAATVPDVIETVDRERTLAGCCHVCVPGVESEALLVLLDEAGVCASAGSACASGALEPSHVLVAMGVDPSMARGSLRLTLGPSTTAADVDTAVAAIASAAARLRSG